MTPSSEQTTQGTKLTHSPRPESPAPAVTQLRCHDRPLANAAAHRVSLSGRDLDTLAAMSVTIREARPDDAPTIYRFIRALADYEREPDAVEVTPEILRTQMTAESPPFGCLIAEWKGAPAGMAMFFQTYSTWTGCPGLYLEDLFVDEEHRGKGIGNALMVHLAQHAVAHGLGRFEWSILDWNERAIGFYERLGAVAQDEWTVYRLAGDALARLGSARS